MYFQGTINSHGGAIYLSSGNMDILDNTFISNSPSYHNGHDGAIYAYSSKVNLLTLILVIIEQEGRVVTVELFMLKAAILLSLIAASNSSTTQLVVKGEGLYIWKEDILRYQWQTMSSLSTQLPTVVQ